MIYVDFWNPRQHHLSGALKNSNTPKTNLREGYHSSYITGDT